MPQTSTVTVITPTEDEERAFLHQLGYTEASAKWLGGSLFLPTHQAEPLIREMIAAGFTHEPS